MGRKSGIKRNTDTSLRYRAEAILMMPRKITNKRPLNTGRTGTFVVV